MSFVVFCLKMTRNQLLGHVNGLLETFNLVSDGVQVVPVKASFRRTLSSYIQLHPATSSYIQLQNMGQTSLPGLHGWITFFLLSGECFSCLCYYMFAATLTEHRVRFQVAMQEEVVVITPINILLISGCECWSLMKIKLMLLPNQHIVHRGRRILMRWWSWCDDLMMMMMIMTVVSVEQSPGRGVHVSSPCLLGYFFSWSPPFLFIYLFSFCWLL